MPASPSVQLLLGALEERLQLHCGGPGSNAVGSFAIGVAQGAVSWGFRGMNHTFKTRTWLEKCGRAVTNFPHECYLASVLLSSPLPSLNFA